MIIRVLMNVDEERVMDAAGTSALEDAISTELGWTAASGIDFIDWNAVNDDDVVVNAKLSEFTKDQLLELITQYDAYSKASQEEDDFPEEDSAFHIVSIEDYAKGLR